MKKTTPFHLAIPVDDLQECISFYEEVLGCSPGRSAEQWVDYNFFGHQLVLHLDPNRNSKSRHNQVDGKSVPVPHFGVVLPWGSFDSIANRLKEKGVEFIVEPYLRFKGLPGEQKTLFFCDPARNTLEFKSFKNIDQLFAT